MSRFRPHTLTAWRIAGDIAAALTAFVAAFGLRFHTGLFAVSLGVPSLRPYLWLLPFIAVLWPTIFAIQRLYRPARVRSFIDESFRIGVGAVLATMLLFGIDAYYRVYALRDLPIGDRFQYSRIFVLLFLGFNVALTVATRALIRHRVAALRRRGLQVRRILIVGAGRLGETVTRKLDEHPDYGLHVVGFVDDDPAKKGTRVAGREVLGTTSDILGLIHQERAEELILALPWSAHDTMLQILEDTSKEYLEVKVVPDLLQYIAIRAGLEDLDGLPVLNLAEDPLHAWDWFLKRVFDIVVACVGLVVTAPLMAVVAYLVRRSSAGPVLFRQERLGLDGKVFHMYKFRTMGDNAEATTGPVFATNADPRCTPVGRWLRQLSLDELPQLWNVLRGDMSIVGPRPERPSFVSHFKEQIPRYMLRHKVKSGITGWAQVNGWRGNTSIPKRIEHDLYYLNNWSLSLDLKIVWLTIIQGLREPASLARARIPRR